MCVSPVPPDTCLPVYILEFKNSNVQPSELGGGLLLDASMGIRNHDAHRILWDIIP
jgi:hypothetical protein